MNSYDDDFNDWLSELPEDTTDVSELGPDLSNVNDLTPKKFVKSIFAVYNHLGGDSWLLAQAKVYPKEFLALIKSIIPKNISYDSSPRKLNTNLSVEQIEMELRNRNIPLPDIGDDDE